MARESESLLSKLKSRSVKLLLASMVRESDLSGEGCLELRKMLDCR